MAMADEGANVTPKWGYWGFLGFYAVLTILIFVIAVARGDIVLGNDSQIPEYLWLEVQGGHVSALYLTKQEVEDRIARYIKEVRGVTFAPELTDYTEWPQDASNTVFLFKGHFVMPEPVERITKYTVP